MKKLFLLCLLSLVLLHSVLSAECTSTPSADGCTVTGDLNITPGTYNFSQSSPSLGIQVDSTVTIDCQGAIFDGEYTGTRIFNINTGGVTIKNCVIQNLGDSSIAIGANAGTDHTIQGNTFINMTNPISAAASSYTNMKIINNQFDGPSNESDPMLNVLILSQNTTVQGNGWTGRASFTCGDGTSEGCVDLNYIGNGPSAWYFTINNAYGLYMYGNANPDSSFLLQPNGRGNNITNNEFGRHLYFSIPYVTANTYFYNNSIDGTNGGILGDADDGDKITYCLDGIGNRFINGAQYGITNPLGPDGSFGDNNIWGASCPYLKSAYLMKNEFVSGGYLLPALNTTSDNLSMVNISTGLTNDSAFGFDGASSNLISLTDDMPIAGSDEWSVCWRYKSNSTTLQRVVSQQGVFAPHLYATPGTFSLLMSDYDFAWDKYYEVPGWSSNIWREDCITKDTTSGFAGFTFYSNGVETPLSIQSDDASGIDTAFPSGTGALWYIGGNDQDQWFSGEISEVCMFEKELSSAEVTRLASQSQCGFAPANDIVIEPPPCINLQSDTTYTGHITVCAGEHNVARVSLGDNAYMEFEPGVTVTGYSTALDNEPVIRIIGNNVTLDCHSSGYPYTVTGWYDGDGSPFDTGADGEGTFNINLIGPINDTTIQNCYISHGKFGLFTWYDSYNTRLINLTFSDGLYSIMHGIGDNGYAENININDPNNGWFLIGRNATIVNSTIPWLSVGRQVEQPNEDGNWGSVRIYNSTFSGNIAKLSDDGLLDFRDNTIDYLILEGQNPEYVSNGVIAANQITTLEDYFDQDISNITFCDIPTKRGNKYNDGYYAFSNADPNLGTCSCQYLSNGWSCTLSEDATLTEAEYDEVSIQTNAANVKLNCGNSLFRAAENNNTQDVTFMNINNDGITIEDCRFDGYTKIAQINANNVTFNRITDNHRRVCWNPPSCTDVNPGYFYQVNNINTQGRNVVINNSNIMGDVQLDVSGKDAYTTLVPEYEYCAEWSPEYYLGNEANAVNNVVIVSNDNLNGIQNTSWQSFQIAGPDPARLTMGITLNITNITYEDPSAYLRVIISSTPDTDGQLHEMSINAEQMRLGENQILWGNGPYMVELNSSTTYYLIFQAYAGPDANFRLSANVVDGGDYTEGEFIFYDNVADPQNNKGGIIRNESYDSIIGIMFASATPEYVPNSQNCVLWDYVSFGATEGECAPGFWNADLSRCENPLRRAYGGNCYGNNGCTGGWTYVPPVTEWYACNLDDVTPVNFVMENTVINRSAGTIAYGSNSGDGRANRFFEHNIFPFAYLAKSVVIRNNTYIWPESTGFEDPIDGWIDSQHSVHTRYAGVVDGQYVDNIMWNAKAGPNTESIEWDYPGCPNINIYVANNNIYPTETGLSGLSIDGVQNSTYENNVIDSRGYSIRDPIRLINGREGVFTNNVIIRNNTVINTTAINVGQLLGHFTEIGGFENISIYDNDFTNAYGGVDPDVGFFRMGIYYTNGTSRLPVNVKVYNNKFGNIRFWQMPKEVDMCNGVGNTYNGIFRINLFSTDYYDNDGVGIPGMEYYLPDCDMNVSRYIELKHNQGVENESGVILGRNHTITVGGLVGIAVEDEFPGGKYNPTIKDIKLRGSTESSIILDGTTEAVVQHLDVQQPYYDYGTDSEFRSMVVPAPTLLSISPSGEITSQAQTFRYSVSTIAELSNCSVFLSGTPINVETGFSRNQKSFDISVPHTLPSQAAVSWQVQCSDPFGNTVITSLSNLNFRAGGGGGPPIIPPGQKAGDILPNPIITFGQNLQEAAKTLQSVFTGSSDTLPTPEEKQAATGVVILLVAVVGIGSILLKKK